MQIKVLQHHIDEGVATDPYVCPIANAIREQYPQFEHIVVHGWIVLDGRWWETPTDAISFIARFDGGFKVKPFEFDLKGNGNDVKKLTEATLCTERNVTPAVCSSRTCRPGG